MNTINSIISRGSSLAYNQFLLQQEIYSLLMMRKCPEIKYLNIMSIKHQIFYHFYHSATKVHLESLCELTCDTIIDSTYFYGLARICQYMQRIKIINKNTKVNHGIVKLIEAQKNLKYFEWSDSFNDEEEDYEDLMYNLADPYTEIFLALEEHANILNHLVIDLYYDYGYNFNNYSFLQDILLEFHNLKTLKSMKPVRF